MRNGLRLMTAGIASRLAMRPAGYLRARVAAGVTCGPITRSSRSTHSTARYTRLRRVLRLASSLLGTALVILTTRPAPSHAQVIQGVYNPRDDQYRILGLIRAQAELEQAEAELDRATQLHAANAVTANELSDRRAAFTRARVNYLQQSLAVIFAAPHISIERAVKSRDSEGRGRVLLTLRNTTGGGVESAKISELIDNELLERLRPDEINNVYVSLKADPGLGGAIISSPYEARIPVLRTGESVQVGFRLLRDADEVVVSFNYADKVEERKVFLEKDASANIVAVQSVQFSQEADLGGQAVFDLQLERFTGDDKVFRLAAIGLPRDLRHEFREPGTGARLSQIRFPEGESQRTLQLVVTLPQRVPESFPIDEPLDFWALVVDDDTDATLRELLADAAAIPEALAALPTGKTRLELLPRGVGRVEVRALNLYHEIRPGEAVEMDVLVRNVGTRRLDNLWLRLDTPTGWQAEVDPELITALDVGAEREFRIVLRPPANATVGDYEARLRTEVAAAERGVETEDKLIRIHLAAPLNWVGTGALVLLLLGVVIATIAFGLRLARR